jgi:ParB family chromosome partitioning protein
MQLQQIRCVDIRPDPASDGYPASAVEPLADDIRSHGVLRPVLLRETAQGYVIVHGERRWRAAALAGLDAVPALVVSDLTRRDAVTA